MSESLKFRGEILILLSESVRLVRYELNILNEILNYLEKSCKKCCC